MDPLHNDHQFVESWQGVHNVRFLEKLDDAGGVAGWELIWGQPKHTMRKYYDTVCKRWPELKEVNFSETFCRALAKKPRGKLPGFRVATFSLDDTRARADCRWASSRFESDRPPPRLLIQLASGCLVHGALAH